VAEKQPEESGQMNCLTRRHRGTKTQRDYVQTDLGKQIVVALLAILFFRTVEAQTSLANAIDPNEVFTAPELVESVETLPLYFAERERVSFYDYEQTEWKSYNYPEFPLYQDETASPSFVENDDGSFMLKVDYGISCTDDCEDYGDGYVDFTPPQAATPRERWHFDLTTGAFTQFEPVCGNFARALSGQGEWVLSYDDFGYYLCNTETEQRSNPLTELPERYGTALLTASSLSPGNRYLLFNYPYDAAIYAYDFQDNQLTDLGRMQVDSALFTLDYPKIEWVDGQNLMLENFSSNYGDDHYYLYRANAAQTDSLELLYHSNRTTAFQVNAPHRYIWIGQQFPDINSNSMTSSEEACTIHEYTPSSNTINSYYIEGICSYGWTIADGTDDRLAIHYSDNANTSRSLIRFNLTTGLREEILFANIQSIAGLSPDGHYVVLVIEDEQSNFQYLVFNLQTYSYLEPLYPSNYQYSEVQWINNQTFFQNSPDESLDDFIFHIANQRITVQSGQFYPSYMAFSPNNHLLILKWDEETLQILNILTLETTTIAEAPDGTVIYGIWDDDGLINITLWYEDYYHEKIGRWRVHLNI
jgi:hypothetical protein